MVRNHRSRGTATAVGPFARRDIETAAARFAHVDTWVFDLDNTLYPAGSSIWPKIDERITRYLAELFGIDGLSARGLQKFYYQRYGTTLAGLIADHKISHEQFLGFVHDIDRSSLAPHPALVEAITALPGRKLILTNGSSHHAPRTTEQLGFVRYLRGRVRHRRLPTSYPSPTRRPMTGFSTGTGSTRSGPPCSRTSPATSSCRTSAAC